MDHGLLIRLDEQHARLWYGDGSHLGNRGGNTVVFGYQAVEHGGVRAAGTNGHQLLAGVLDGSGHVLFCFELNLIDHEAKSSLNE